MDNQTFNSIVEKYKNELKKYIKKNKININVFDKERKVDTENNKSNLNHQEDITYTNFLKKNNGLGHLKIESFCDGNISMDGIRIKITKSFTDGQRTFFDGYTDQNGKIDDISLPVPSNISEKAEINIPILNKTTYNIETSSDKYMIDSENTVTVYNHIDSIYPLKIILPQKDKTSN